jgi:hypothetical protein
LAEKIGLPRASYANIEAGRQRIPVDIIWRAAIVLGVPISSLVPEPVNKASAADFFASVADNSTSGVTTMSGTGSSDGTTLTYVGSSPYSTISHFSMPATPAVVQKKPSVMRVVRGSKSGDR